MSEWYIRYLIAKNKELRGTIEDLKFEIKSLKKYCANLEDELDIHQHHIAEILNKFNDYQKEDYSKTDEVQFNDCIYYKDLKYDCTGEITCLEHRIESFIKDFEKGKINFDEVE